MKKFIALLLALLLLCSLTACGNRVLLHCDAEGCDNTFYGEERIDDSWILYCGSCSETLHTEE
ncbi:MAG: hypothetical protein J6Q54_05875 [Oscillospiraceae bacterium]|nr:hypothetical protein [Oscillospiraceae bacterium]